MRNFFRKELFSEQFFVSNNFVSEGNDRDQKFTLNIFPQEIVQENACLQWNFRENGRQKSRKIKGKPHG